MPLALALAMQLIIIVTAPSTAQKATVVGAGSGSAQAAAAGTDAASNAGPEAAADAGTAAGSGRGGGGRAGGTAPAALPPGVSTSGDTSHCVAGREFDPNIAYWAPPCVPGTPGGPSANNGGATAPGVTADAVTVVNYVTNYGAEVNAILKAQGQLVTADDARPFDSAMQNFINKHFVLYGRKVKVITYQGQCRSVPPDLPCLIAEIDRVVDTYHPYIFEWLTTVCSACFAEIARKGVVAFGGDGFSDEFANQLSPYFYTGGESATRMERAFGEWWCKQLSSVSNPNRKVRYAQTNNPAQNFNGQPRRLGVISTNDPDNKDTVNKVLAPALAKCGDKIWHSYFYDENINTAAQQVEAGVSAMDTPSNAATTVLCLCDSVAPAFLLQGEQRHNYLSENLIASKQHMDWDLKVQSYDPTIA